jgi:hypothetical protein
MFIIGNFGIACNLRYKDIQTMARVIKAKKRPGRPPPEEGQRPFHALFYEADLEALRGMFPGVPLGYSLRRIVREYVDKEWKGKKG